MVEDAEDVEPAMVAKFNREYISRHSPTGNCYEC